MGAPTKAQAEAWFDRLSAVLQAEMDGLRTEYTPAAGTHLYAQVDASGDPAVEIALLSQANTIDEMSLPANIATWLPFLMNRPGISAFINAFNNLVLSASGGSNASLRAYLNSVSAKLHPLAGEAIRIHLGQTAFGTADQSQVGVSNPTYAALFPTRVYQGADGSLSAETTDAQSASTGDVTLFASDDHALYLGLDRKFEAVVIALSTLANTSITPTFQYWNGSAWTTLAVTDNSSGLTKNDAITFTAPSDWTRHYKDAGGTAFADACPLYYVRIARTEDTVSQTPVGTCITLIPTAIAGPGGTGHYGYPQPPLALCRITAASTMTVTLPANMDYTRFAAPVGSEGNIRLRALTPIGSNLTVTLAYVDGAGANASNAQSSWTAPAALGTKQVALANADADAIRSVRTSSTVSTSATEGVFVVELLPIRSPSL